MEGGGPRCASGIKKRHLLRFSQLRQRYQYRPPVLPTDSLRSAGGPFQASRASEDPRQRLTGLEPPAGFIMGALSVPCTRWWVDVKQAAGRV